MTMQGVARILAGQCGQTECEYGGLRFRRSVAVDEAGRKTRYGWDISYTAALAYVRAAVRDHRATLASMTPEERAYYGM